jgi:hypothetical protein
MSKDLSWQTCRHCKKESYKSAEMHRNHEEDCGYIMLRAGIRKCPKCEEKLTKLMHGSWICTNESCDYQIGIVGAKAPE